LVIVFVGDVDWSVVEEAVRGGVGDWSPHASAPLFEAQGRMPEPGREELRMPDKQNVDVRIGHNIPVRRHHKDFLPLYLATFILGGNFSARLMTKIRGEMGLTYGIRSGLHGLDKQYDGHWQVGVTLSEENVERGIEATLAEIRHFVDQGVSEDEVEDKKTTVTGTFKVGLATTGGLADRLLRNVRRGFEVTYLDRFSAEVEAITPDQVNEAIRKYIHPEAFQIALAGMLPVV
jgi:predicted Zn-dependent peptidase